MKSRLSVLILEDSQTFSMYLALLLQRMGFKSLRVSRPEAAKFVLTRGFTDLLIVGDQPGPEAPHEIVRELAGCIPPASIPILVISRQNNPAERAACLAAGCSSYLSKPVQPKQLHEALHENTVPPSERRRNLRSTVDMIASVSIEEQPGHPHQVLCLSRRGALISATETLPTGTRVALQLPLGDEQIALAGTVLYNLTNPENRTPRAFGVLFHQVDTPLADQIDAYLEAMLAECRLMTPETDDSDEEKQLIAG